MRSFLRFLFSAADQARITAAFVTASDTPYAAAPAVGTPYPQSLRLTVPVTGLAPQVLPLFPGRLRFLADPAAPGTLPAPADVNPANYPQWRTRGTLMVSFEDTKLAKELGSLMAPVGVVPTTAWYGPVDITQDFLFVTLATGLAKEKVGAVRPTDAGWSTHAISQFLAGRFQPKLRLGASAADDDVARFPMPRLVVDAGTAALTVTLARRQKPQDGRDFAAFNAGSGATPETDPAHHSFGAIPARHVYRTVRVDLLDAAAGTAVPDAILADWPAAPRYFPIRVTRTFKPIDNCSVHLPTKTIQVTAGTTVVEQRLPAHGVFFFTRTGGLPVPAPTVTVTINGGLRFLDGATADVWRVRGGTAALTVNLATVTAPHIVVRRRMNDEIFADKARPENHDDACTYFSMRRTMRALLDNRICGGRLVAEGTKTSQVTRQLLDDAFAGTHATSEPVIRGKPSTAGPPGLARKFENILRAFFPNQPAGHSLDDGQVFYHLWQSRDDLFRSATHRASFADAHVGRGSAGSLVFGGLAPGYVIDPVRQAGESTAAFADRIAGLMLTTLTPGTLIQFWDTDQDYQNIKNRVAGPVRRGHSPIFSHYLPDDPATGLPRGLVVIDQFGDTDYPVVGAAGNRRIGWGEHRPEIWAAASIDE